MSEDMLYVHYETVSNYVLSKGIAVKDYTKLARKLPENLLLVDGRKSIGTYDNHTGFQVIKGQENVKAFFQKGTDNQAAMGKWIDFVNVDMLHLLTPIEISEILYIAHAHTHLHSPFYYKLQNNYIYLTLPNGFIKMYYRYLEQFHELFAEAITVKLKEKVNEKKRFYQKSKEIAPFPIERVKEFIPIFKEGAVISFRQMSIEENTYCIPLFIAEDRYASIGGRFNEKDSVGTICYDMDRNEWKIDIDFE